MRHILKILILILFISTPFSLNAQSPQWIVYNTGNSGLPDNGIKSLAINQNENVTDIWVGTFIAGLAKFDGNNSWEVFDTSNSIIKDNAIFSIGISRFNTIWINTFRGGIVKYDGLSWTIYDTSNSPLHSNLWYLAVQDTTVWICSTTKGLFKFDGVIWTIYDTTNSGIFDNYPQVINFDKITKTKWIGSYPNIAVSIYNDTNWIIYTGENSPMTYGNIKAIEMDKNNVKWIASQGGGLTKFNEIDSTWGNYFNPGFLSCLVIDSAQNKWFGSPGGGLYKFEGDSVLINFRPENSPLPSYSVYALALDSNQNLWIGTGNGLVVYNENGIVGINNQNIIYSPKSFILYQNYPNPFNPVTRIKYRLNKTSDVNLSVFNIKGQLVETIVSSRQKMGSYETIFNADNLPSGTYFYTLATDSYNETRKMILLK